MKWLNGTDALMLYSEKPNVHIHTLKVAIMKLDEDCRNFDIEVFRRAIRSRLYKLEPLSYQLVCVPLKLHHPMWREHCDIDLDYHIRPFRLPSPGGRRELHEAIGEIASTPLDRRRPLWEMYVVCGLSDGRVAVVAKVHHALVDGVGAANLLARSMDLQPGLVADPCLPDPAPGKRQLVKLAFADHLHQAGRIPCTIRDTVQSLARVHRSSRRAVVRSAAPPPMTPAKSAAPPATFMNHFLAGPERRFASVSLALADVKRTAKHLGVTVNDLVLAMTAGALRSLLLRYDKRADPLVALIPVSSDFSVDRVSGNCADAMSIALPVDVQDPLERVQRCHENAILSKQRHRLRGSGLLSRWLDCALPVAVECGLRMASSRKAVSKMPNVTIANVHGDFPRYGRVGGALVTEIYSVGHLAPWSGLNVTVWSYVDQLNIAVLTDAATVDDPHEVTAAINAEFIEICGNAGQLRC